MNAEVTIGIPVYKSVDYIEKTMLSVLSQTFDSIEYLIIDDFGNDGSLEVLAKLQNSHKRGGAIRILHNDQNRGVSYCRNRIIDEAQGRYLYFMDSDDLIEPGTIQLLYDSLMLYQCEISYGSYEIIDEVGIIPKGVFRKPPLVLSGDFELATYAFEHVEIFHVSVCNALIDLQFLRKAKVRFIEVSYWEDMAFSIELAIKVSRAVLVPDITYHYIHHSNSLSHNMKRENNLRDEIENNVFVLNYLKRKTLNIRNSKYIPFLCCNLETNSYYAICNIIKKAQLIPTQISKSYLQDIIRFPLNLCDILKLKNKKVQILFFWLLGIIPPSLFLFVIKVVGKIKKTI